jgi:cytochrome b561
MQQNQPNDPVENYSLTSKLLHWSTALMMLFLFILGVYMIDLGYYDKNYTLSYSVHKAVGLIALVLAICQVLWALTHKSPVLISSIKYWEKIAAYVMHKLLFLLIILIPASGYAIAVAAGQGVELFGLITVPAIFPEMLEMEDVASDAHFYLTYAGAGLVTLHVLAALKHHFFDRDKTLKRMLH